MEKKFLRNAEELGFKAELLNENELLAIDGGNRQPGKAKDLFDATIDALVGGTIGGPIGAALLLIF